VRQQITAEFQREADLSDAAAMQARETNGKQILAPA
jgi:hypothetical protein